MGEEMGSRIDEKGWYVQTGASTTETALSKHKAAGQQTESAAAATAAQARAQQAQAQAQAQALFGKLKAGAHQTQAHKTNDEALAIEAEAAELSHMME